MAAGRPTDYKPEYCEMLVEHMKKGFSFESFAAVVDCTRSTIYKWVETHPEFSDAQSKGKMHSAMFWENMGINGAMGALDGFNASAWIFNMKNRHNWRDKTETELSTSKDEDKKLIIKFTKED